MPDLSAIRKAVPDFTHVTVRTGAIAAFVSRIERRHLRLPDWRGPAFPAEDNGATAGLMVVANAINFSFWGEPQVDRPLPGRGIRRLPRPLRSHHPRRRIRNAGA